MIYVTGPEGQKWQAPRESVQAFPGVVNKNGNLYASEDAWNKMLGFRSGGYTGTWDGNEGRAAILHKKEYVLNDTDTKNVLAAVAMSDRIMRGLQSLNLGAPHTTNNQEVTVNFNFDKLDVSSQSAKNFATMTIKELEKRGVQVTKVR